MLRQCGLWGLKIWQKFNCCGKNHFLFSPTHADGQHVSFFKPVLVIYLPLTLTLNIKDTEQGCHFSPSLLLFSYVCGWSDTGRKGEMHASLEHKEKGPLVPWNPFPRLSIHVILSLPLGPYLLYFTDTQIEFQRGKVIFLKFHSHQLQN